MKNLKEKVCVICQNKFKTAYNAETCCEHCTEENRKRKVRLKLNKRFENKIENKDYIVCQYCGAKFANLNNFHLKSHNTDLVQYKIDFPGYLTQSEEYKKSSTKSSGKHMKQPEYRKLFSELLKGENNPNHCSRTSEEERKERSPFSKNFYEKRNKTEKDRSKFVKDALKNRISDTTIEYWLNKGFSQEEAEQKLKERQTTFSLEKCIAKYGDEVGLQRWKERQEKWKSKVFNEDTFIGRGRSNLSEDILEQIIKYDNKKYKLLYGQNEKFIFDSENKRTYKYDMTNNDLKKNYRNKWDFLAL